MQRSGRQRRADERQSAPVRAESVRRSKWCRIRSDGSRAVCGSCRDALRLRSTEREKQHSAACRRFGQQRQPLDSRMLRAKESPAAKPLHRSGGTCRCILLAWIRSGGMEMHPRPDGRWMACSRMEQQRPLSADRQPVGARCRFVVHGVRSMADQHNPCPPPVPAQRSSDGSSGMESHLLRGNCSQRGRRRQPKGGGQTETLDSSLASWPSQSARFANRRRPTNNNGCLTDEQAQAE